MGSYFSTRWNCERTRQDTGGLLFLDATKLRTMGALAPGTLASHEWTNGRGDVVGATPCTYGGERLWLTCPSCHSRRRVLYSVVGRFRCRQCHDLAYASTREDTHDRSIRRTRKLHKRLSASGNDLFTFPDKPRGMHWGTYEHIARQLDDEHDLRLSHLRAFLDKRESLVARLTEGVEQNRARG